MGRADEFARTLGELATMARVGIRSSGFVDTNPVPADWVHVTKIDPEDEKKLPLLYPLYLRHTSAVSIGGSRDVTIRNTAETFALLRHADVPRFHEPSAPHHITEQTWRGSRFTAIPEVLNGDSAALVGELGAAIETARDELVPEAIDETIPWLPRRLHTFLSTFVTAWFLERAIFEAYIIQNPDSAAAREANVTADDLLAPGEAGQRALAAEKHLGSDVVYVEYSGTFGGREALAILEAVSGAVSWSKVWYGGGLDSRADAEAVLDAGADAVVVGDVFHEIADEEAALCAAAADELPAGAPDREVREWLRERRAVAGTGAARFLDTNPGVDDPEGTAASYLAATVRAYLGARALAADADVPAAPDAFRSWALGAAGGGPLPGERAVAPALPRDRDAREFALGALAAVAGVPEAGPLPARHLGVGRPAAAGVDDAGAGSTGEAG